MIKLKFDAQAIRAAMACIDTKDVRYYLTGILLTTTGDIVGTDGACLYHTLHEWKECDVIPCDIIVKIDGVIPATAKTVEIEFPDFEEVDTITGDGVSGTLRTDKGKLFACEIIDGKYPDFNRVIPRRLLEGDENYNNVASVNVSNLAKLEKVYGKNAAVSIYHRGIHNAMRVECSAVPHGVFVVMPTRTDPADCFALGVRKPKS